MQARMFFIAIAVTFLSSMPRVFAETSQRLEQDAMQSEFDILSSLKWKIKAGIDHNKDHTGMNKMVFATECLPFRYSFEKNAVKLQKVVSPYLRIVPGLCAGFPMAIITSSLYPSALASIEKRLAELKGLKESRFLNLQLPMPPTKKAEDFPIPTELVEKELVEKRSDIDANEVTDCDRGCFMTRLKYVAFTHAIHCDGKVVAAHLSNSDVKRELKRMDLHCSRNYRPY